MYANNPRSRIAREYFYILNAMKDHYKALLRLGESEPVRIGPVLILLAIYMLREEGKKHVRPLDIVYETQLPRTSVYRMLNEMADDQVLQNQLGEFMCLSRTPDFLLNPTELYGRPLATVGDKDYEAEEKTKQVMELMVQRAVSEELAKQQQPLAPAGIGVGGIADMRKEAEEMPLAPITIRTTTPPPITPIITPEKKKKEENLDDADIELENDIEEEMEDMFL